MQQFKYNAVDANGKSQRGQIEASSVREATIALSSRGLRATEVRAPLTTQRELALPTENEGAKRVRSAELNLCMEELAVLLSSGVPLAEALANLEDGRRASALKSSLARMLKQLRAGAPLSACIQSEAESLRLPNHSVQLIRAGEETGKLAQSVRAVADQLAEDAEFSKEVGNALTYPSVLVLSGVAATAMVFVFVVPKFAQVLSNPKADLPLLTKWVLTTGLWLAAHKTAAITAILGVLGACVAAAQAQSVRDFVVEQAARLPLLAGLLRQIDTARWAQMLAVLLRNRVPLVDALGHAQQALRLKSGGRAAAALLVDVRGGAALSQAIARHNLLERVGQNLVRVGEQSGRLPDTIQTLAQLERRAVQQKLRRFLVLLEPITILAISVVLGTIMISIMLAITSMSNLI